jgi:arginyl-tRNA synthetase
MKQVKDKLKEILKGLADGYRADVTFEIEFPKSSGFGDLSTNLAMKLAENLSKNPQEIASELKDKLMAAFELKSIIERVEIAGPGFINFFITAEYLANRAAQILKAKKDFGKLSLGRGQKINIEFISANPTGPLTVGNGRGGFFGDALANVLERVGYKVVREYLINDAGGQIEALGHSVLKDGEAVYKGDYIDELNKKFGDQDNIGLAGERAADYILTNYIKTVISNKMKIDFDVWFSERKKLRRAKKIVKVIEWLKEKDLIYELDGAWWFKSADYGDSRDRVLVKSNGEFTYLAQDFAYLKNKFGERKFNLAINVWGADHHGDVPGLLNAAKVLGYEGRQVILLMQFVRLISQGQEFKMSKRRGTYFTMDELIDLVGHDATRFLFLSRSNNTHLDFDVDLAKEKSEKNPVLYVQYAFARISGILRQQEIKRIKAGKASITIDSFPQRELLRELIKWPLVLEEISYNYQVNKLTSYATSLADSFHQFYANCRVIDNGLVNLSNVQLVLLSQKVFKEVLQTIGISALEKM